MSKYQADNDSKELFARKTWQKASYCANGACVEIAHAKNAVGVRDSKLVDPKTGEYKGPILTFTEDEFSSFLAAAKAGEFDN